MEQENLAPGIQNLQVRDDGNDHRGEPLAGNASLANPLSDQANPSSQHSTFTGYNEPYDEKHEAAPNLNENTHYPINSGYENAPAFSSSSTSTHNHDPSQAATSNYATEFPGYLGYDNHAGNPQGAYVGYQGSSIAQVNENQEPSPYSGYPGYSGYSTGASGSQAERSSALNTEGSASGTNTSAAAATPYNGYKPSRNTESGKLFNVNVADYDRDHSEDEDDDEDEDEDEDDGEDAMDDDGHADRCEDEEESLDSALSYHEKMGDLIDL